MLSHRSLQISMEGSFLSDVRESRSWLNPPRTEFLPNNIYNFSSYLTGNTLCLRYEVQTVNACSECRVLVC
jgi:hypothetical protein